MGEEILWMPRKHPEGAILAVPDNRQLAMCYTACPSYKGATLLPMREWDHQFFTEWANVWHNGLELAFERNSERQEAEKENELCAYNSNCTSRPYFYLKSVMKTWYYISLDIWFYASC